MPKIKDVLKQNFKSLLENMGYRLIKDTNLPRGTDNYVYSCKSDNSLPLNHSVEIIFDVGANIGQTANQFAHSFPQAKIFSFEPVKATFETLRKNTIKAGNIICFNLALGSKAERAKINLHANSQLNSLIVNSQTDASSSNEEINIKTIDQFCQENNIDKIDILKTDTEGFDLNVIKGAENLLKANKVLFVFSEVGFKPSDKRHTNFFLLKSYLESFDFKFLGFYDFGYHKAGYLSYCNALFVSRESANFDKIMSDSKMVALL